MIKNCKRLTNGINFNFNGITLCSSVWSNHPDAYIPYEKNYLETFLEKRQNTINNAKNGIYPVYCQNCNMHTHDDENNNNKIKYIDIYHWYQCNCACFYCSNREITNLKITERKNQKGVIDVMKALKTLEKMELIDEKAQISLTGGEPTILKEFSDILKFAIKHKYEIVILSNGILYEKYISKSLNEIPKSNLIVSLDSGSREMFRRIKGVDKFEDVIKNLKKYVSDTKENSNKIMSKYILLPGVNDNKEEIDKWIEVSASIGITNLFPTLEFCKSANDPQKENIPERICELYEYMKQRIKEFNPDFQVSTYSFVEDFVKYRSYKIPC